jgi:CHASE2 domain-containing sensor protein
MDNPKPSINRHGVGGLLHRARRPDRAHMGELRLRVPFWFVFAFLFVFAAIQIILNPFGFSDLTQRYTQDISNLLITGPYFYPETGRDRISVALVEDSTLADMQMPWPWSYGAQARALGALLAYQPRAVIVDVLFVDPRNDPTLPELIDEIGRYKKAGVPLYLVGATDTQTGQLPVRKEILATGVKLVDPTILINQGVVRQYPATGQCYGAQRTAGASCPSLALQVYKDLYPDQPLAPLNGLMEIVWGTHPNPFNAKWMRVTDDNGVVHSCSFNQDVGWAKRVYLAFFDPADVRSQCPYEGVIPVETLLGENDDPDIAKLAHNRVVFYGASLEGVQDKAFTPVNGLIAGVFTHAMALDNLITFQGRPQQNVVTVGGFVLDSNTVQMIAIVPVILILTWLHMLRLRGRRARAAATGERSAALEFFVDKVLGFIWHWLAFGLALAAGLLLARAVGLSVANWVDVVFVSVALAAMLLVGLPDAIWGYLHHVARGMPQRNEEQES